MCVKRFVLRHETSIPFPFNPSSSPLLSYSFRAFSSFHVPSRLITDFVSSFHTAKTEKRRNLSLKKVVKKKHGGCPWMFQLWRLCVVFLCCYCRRVAVCADACTYSPLPPSFSRPWCGADGDRDFFFYKLLYIDRAQSKLLSKNHVVCIVFVSKKQSDIRLRTAQRREHQLGKDYPSCFGSDDLIA